MRDVTAILLCGGKGERLRPLTESVPKPLVPLRGKPLLEHLLTYLHAEGFRRFVLCVGYKAEMVEAFLAEHRLPGAETVCVNSGERASITDRLFDARAHVPERALVCYGDTLANVDFTELRRTHVDAGLDATLTVHPLQSPFGIVEVTEDGRVTGFSEKPVLPHWINIGFLLCEPAALARLRRGSDMPDYLAKLAADRRLGVHRHRGRHLTVNTEKDRGEAELLITDFYTLPRGVEE
jgi:glucose-1-phosphate cytidylyltransferase